LGVPYKPSIIRSHLLSDAVMDEYNAKRFSAAEVVTNLLEKNRETVAQEYFGKIIELNMIDIKIPCILAAVLKNSNTREMLSQQHLKLGGATKPSLLEHGAKN
jgi:hypothetical protein